MGIFIFLTAVVVEITFAVFCIVTKSNQKRVRSIIRISAFTFFIVLSISSIIEWSFRYYALAALLFLLAVIGGFSLIHKKEEQNVYKSARVILKAIGMIVLIFMLIFPAIIFPQNKAIIELTGKYKISTKNYTYIDTKRIETYTDTGENRKLNVEFWYPQDAEGTYPLIVFSHGSFGIKLSNESLYNELASHGYVVCSIDHKFQCLYTTDEEGQITLMDRGYIKEIFSENAQNDRQQSYEYYKKWMKIRTDDINFVIDYIITETENNDSDIVYKLVDTTKIGVMGHSLGGSAALGIGRIRDDISGVIALESPFMCDIKGIERGEFIFEKEIYPVPVLNVYSDSSWSRLAYLPQYANNYILLSGTDATAFNVYISEAGHLNLTDLALTSPLMTHMLNGEKITTTKDSKHCLKLINKICLEFFDCYLKGAGEFTSREIY